MLQSARRRKKRPRRDATNNEHQALEERAALIERIHGCQSMPGSRESLYLHEQRGSITSVQSGDVAWDRSSGDVFPSAGTVFQKSTSGALAPAALRFVRDVSR